MPVAVLVPLAPGDDWRAAAWFMTARHLHEHRWPVHVGAGDPADWRKGAALARALAQTDADVLVVHDADVICAADALDRAVQLVEDGAAWVVPHTRVHRLHRDTTRALHNGAPFPPPAPLYDRPPYVGVIGGGVTVLRRECYEAAPVDARFHSWGSEDECFGRALETLYGRPQRLSGDLWHLWHPHPAPHQRRNATPEAENLWRAYRRALGHPDWMRQVLAGARDHSATR